MWRLLFVVLIIFAVTPVFAYTNSVCTDTVSEQPSLQFDYESHTYDEMPGIYADAVLAYLNSGASVNELAAAIETANQDYIPHYAQLMQADFTADTQNEILLHLTISWGGTFEAYLMLFSCEDGNNQHLDTMAYGGWDAGGYGSIVYAMDINNNQLRDIVLEYPTVEGMKTHDWLVIYEWDGDSLEQTFQLGPYYGIFSGIELVADGENPTTPILNVGYFYAYEEETASAFIEYSVVRSIDMIYRWDGSDYQFVCRHFTDDPSMYPTILHSAETYRACGDYENASLYYQQIFELAWRDQEITIRDEYDRGNFSSWPWIVFPENLEEYEEQALYVESLERAYYEAFAAYRLLQIGIYQSDNWQVDNQIGFLSAYTEGEHGYVYAAMANTLWQNYRETNDLSQACNAAEQVFNEVYANGDDPGIVYEDDPSGYHYGFYFANMRSYAADPDNLFAVPDTIDGMVSTPICL